MLLRFYLSLISIVLVSACGELPKPFAGGSNSVSNPLVVLSGGGGIKVVMDPDVPNFISDPLVKFMVNSLIEQDIPASSRSDFSARYTLWGRVKVLSPTVFVPEDVEIRWSLSSATDQTNFSLKYVLSGEHPGWLFLDKDPFARIKLEMGKDIATLLYTDHKASQVSSKPVYKGFLAPHKPRKAPAIYQNNFFEGKPAIFISGIIGASERGNYYMHSSLQQKLSYLGAYIVDERKDSNFRVKGFISYSPAYGKVHNIATTWLVTNGEGQKLGRVSQKTQVSNDLSNEEWQKLSEKIVATGLPEISKLINAFITASRKNKNLLK